MESIFLVKVLIMAVHPDRFSIQTNRNNGHPASSRVEKADSAIYVMRKVVCGISREFDSLGMRRANSKECHLKTIRCASNISVYTAQICFVQFLWLFSQFPVESLWSSAQGLRSIFYWRKMRNKTKTELTLKPAWIIKTDGKKINTGQGKLQEKH